MSDREKALQEALKLLRRVAKELLSDAENLSPIHNVYPSNVMRIGAANVQRAITLLERR